MRKFTSGAGADTTATVKAFLAAAAEPIIFTAVVIQRVKWLDTIGAPFGLPITASAFQNTWLLTDCPAAFVYTPIGTFQSAILTNEGGKNGEPAIACEIGTEFKGFDVTWTPRSSDIVSPGTGAGWFAVAPNISASQGVIHGFWDGAFVSVYKVVMPTFGDANTYGMCLINRGCVDKAELNGAQIKFTVESPFKQTNQQIPSQLIGPNSRFASLDPMAYVGVSTISSGGGPTDAVRWTQFQADPARPQSASLLTSFCYPTGATPATGFFDGGFVVWTFGPLTGMRRPIAHSVSDLVHNVITFHLAQPFPYDQTLFSSGFAFGFGFDAYARRNPTSTESSGTYNGLANVPLPEDGF